MHSCHHVDSHRNYSRMPLLSSPTYLHSIVVIRCDTPRLPFVTVASGSFGSPAHTTAEVLEYSLTCHAASTSSVKAASERSIDGHGGAPWILNDYHLYVGAIQCSSNALLLLPSFLPSLYTVQPGILRASQVPQPCCHPTTHRESIL